MGSVLLQRDLEAITFFRAVKSWNEALCETNRLYGLNVDKGLDTCMVPLFIWHGKDLAVEAGSIVALVIILGFGYWIAENNKEKNKQEAMQTARANFIALANKAGVDSNTITNDLVGWLEKKILLQTSGKYDLQYYTNELEGLLEEDGQRAVIVQLMLLQLKYENKKQVTKQNLEWVRYIDSFKRMNQAQQNHEITRLKKAADPQSDDDASRINTLRLIQLGGTTNTDIMVGDIKLFSVRKEH